MKKTKAVYSLYVGIDISKGKADAAVLQVFPDRSRKDKLLRKKVRVDFSKSAVDMFHQTILKYADEQCTGIIYAMEDTGIYYRDFYTCLASILLEQESILILKPSYVSHWCQLHERSKSDPLDAQSIAQIIAYERDFKTVQPSFTPEKRKYSALRTETRRYQQLRKMNSQESTRLISQADVHCPELAKVFGTGMTFLKVLSVFPSTYDIIRVDKQELLTLIQTSSKNRFGQKQLDLLLALCEDSLSQQEPSQADRRMVRSLVRHVLSLREELTSIKANLRLLCLDIPGYGQLISMPGFGTITSAIVLAEVMDIQRFRSAEALVAYAGTNPVNKRSGSSVHTEGKISRNGSRYLRHAIVVAAEVARRNNPVLAELFSRLKAGQRKRHCLAVVAVANKLLHYVYSVLKSQKDFVINFKDLQKLKEETRSTFFQNITTEIPKGNLKCVYRYEDGSGEIHPFIYTARHHSQAAMESF